MRRAATGQSGTCWIASDGSLFYASNAGSGKLSGYRDTGSGALSLLGRTATGAGTVDAAASSGGQYFRRDTLAILPILCSRKWILSTDRFSRSADSMAVSLPDAFAAGTYRVLPTTPKCELDATSGH
jgi:hypothetical protein